MSKPGFSPDVYSRSSGAMLAFIKLCRVLRKMSADTPVAHQRFREAQISRPIAGRGFQLGNAYGRHR